MSWLVWFCNKVYQMYEVFFFTFPQNLVIAFLKDSGPERKKSLLIYPKKH